MKVSRRRFLTVFAAAAVAGSSKAGPLTRERFRALGTDAQLTLVGRPGSARTALQACRQELAAIESTFSLYDPRSMLSRLNRDGQIVTSERFSDLLRHALAMAEVTDGAFDPTIQPVWRALANNRDLNRARDLVDWQYVQPTAGSVRFLRGGMALSFNGIAQGYAADRVSAVLAEHGFADTLVDLGEFAARGRKHGRPWRLGIRDPNSGRIAAEIEAKGGAIATSEPNGTRIAGHSHIIDPLNRDGDRWASITVEAHEAWRADALSTAVAASPIDEAARLLERGGALRAWLIHPAGALTEWRAS